MDAALKAAGATVTQLFAQPKSDKVEEILLTLVTVGRARQRGDLFTP